MNQFHVVRLIVISSLLTTAVSGNGRCQEAYSPTERPIADLVVDLASEDTEVQRKACADVRSQIQPGYGLEIPESYQNLIYRTLRRQAKPVFPKIIELLQHKNDEVSGSALHLIQAMGTEGFAAAPIVRKLANDREGWPEAPMSAFYVLCSITPESISVIEQIDLDTVFGLTSRYREAFGEGFDMATLERELDTVPNITVMSIGMEVGMMCQPILVSSGHSKVEIPHLVANAQNEKETIVRLFNIGILGQLGLEAKAAIPALRLLLKDPNVSVRYMAACAILNIELDRDLIDPIVDEIKLDATTRTEFIKDCHEGFDELEKERARVATSFVEYPENYFPWYCAELRFGPGCKKRETLRTLADVGKPAACLAWEILSLLNDEDQETRMLALDALKRIVGQN